MMAAAEALEFERAATLRDRITQMQDAIGERVSDVAIKKSPTKKRGRRAAKGGNRVPKPKKR